jgi:hypothetical protein
MTPLRTLGNLSRGLTRWLVAAAIILPWTHALTRAQSQTSVKLFFWPGTTPPKNSDDGLKTLLLRPNVAQEYFLFIHNPGPEIKGPVTVELRAGGKAVDKAKAVLPRLAAEKTQLISFAPVAPDGKPVPAPPGDKPPPPAELKGVIEAVASVENDKIISNKARVDLGRPSKYLVVLTPQFTCDRDKGTLTVTVRAGKEFSGPPCRIELDLRPDRIPFLAPDFKPAGSYGDELTKAGEEKTLVARDLPLRAGDAPGLVYLTVDGYQRAFTFRITNSPGTSQLPVVQDPLIRLLARDAVSATAPSKISLEADNVPLGARIEMGLYEDDSFSDEKRHGKLFVFPGARQVQLFFTPVSSGGGLLFSSKVADWTDELDATKEFGSRVLRVRLRDKSNQDKPFTRAVREGQLEESVERIAFRMFITSTTPEGVKFIWGRDKTAERGGTLKLKATGRDPKTDIAKVVFFLGKPKEGKLPPDTVAGVRTKDKDIWTADVEIPPDKTGVLDLGVQFTNTAGLDAIALDKVTVVEPKPRGASIKGEVMENGRPQREQLVVLFDLKGMKVKEVKTDKDAKFEFKDVAPGEYLIKVEKTGAMTKAEKPVKLAAGEQVELKEPLDLRR